MLPGVTPPDRTNARTSVTINESLSISAVYASVTILNNWTAQMDLAVFRGNEELPAPGIIAQPEVNTSQYAFIKKSVTSLALTGNAYWFITRRQSDGVPLSLEVLNPLEVQVSRNDAGKTVYNFNGRTYTARNIAHVMTFEVPGRLTGLSPVEASGASMAAVLALRAYADEWFGSGGTVRQHITSAHELDAEQHAEYVKRIKAQKAANNGDLITDGNTKVTNLSLTPSDALYLEQQTFAITDVARWFGIPPYLVLASVDGNSMTYSNLQTDARLFITSTLSGYMKPIEEALSTLLPRGQVVRFRTETLLRADTKERYDAYSAGIAGGFLTVNEVRAKEGLAPLATPAQTTTTEGESNEAA